MHIFICNLCHVYLKTKSYNLDTVLIFNLTYYLFFEDLKKCNIQIRAKYPRIQKNLFCNLFPLPSKINIMLRISEKKQQKLFF